MSTSRPIADRALIGGEWADAQNGREIEVRNPSDDALIATVPECGAADVTSAVDAAHAALPEWRGLPGIERARVLRRLFDLMMRDQDRLAELITLEVGKPVAESRGEISYAAGFIEWSAEEAKRIYGEMVQAFVPDKRILVLRHADRRHCGDHALEPALGHDHAQARSRAGRRMHDGGEASEQDAA